MFAIAVLFAQLAQAAPADQYFGKLGMSTLRIRYETMQLKRRYETHLLLPEQAAHLADLDEDAFDRWASRYPKDPWLASTGFALAGLYAELPGKAARKRTVELYTFVKSKFPNSRYATLSRDALHRGVPIRPDPAWAAGMRATPSPEASPTVAPSASALPPPTPGSTPTPR